MNLKRVLIYGLSGGIGGIEKFIYNVITNTECKYDIITFYNHIENQELYEKNGVRIFKITSKRESISKNHSELKSFFEKNAADYDVLWCNLAELINIDVLKLAKKYGIKKRIIHSHSMTSTRGKLLTVLHYANKKRIGKIATDFWACSDEAGKWFYSEEILNSDKYQIINNAIDTNKFSYNESVRLRMRDELALKNEFVVGYVGRISIPEKNNLFVIEVFNEILKLKPDSRLLLVGDGPDRQIIESRIKELEIEDKTILTGFRNDADELFNAMDVFLLPSNFESFGIVFLEAQCSGLPCFASDCLPRAAAATELMKFISLTKSPALWAEEIVNTDTKNRMSRSKAVADFGFEITSESKRIQKLIEG